MRSHPRLHLLLHRFEPVAAVAAIVGLMWMTPAVLADQAARIEHLPVVGTSASGSTAATRQVSLQLHDVEVRAALKLLAEFASINLVASDGVKGRLSVNLQDMVWDQALRHIVRMAGLALYTDGSVYHVLTHEELNSRQRVDAEVLQRRRDAEPLVAHAFALHYVRAAEVARALLGTSSTTSGGPLAVSVAPSGAHGKWLSAQAQVFFDPRTNQIFISDTAERVQAIGKLLRHIDVPVKQVVIEARIVEADESFGRALGVKYSASLSPQAHAGYSPSSSWHADLSAPTAQAGMPAAATWALSLVGSAITPALQLELSAMETQGRGRVVAHPRLVTTDQNKAIIEQGEELPYPSVGANGQTQVQFRKANLKLEVLPRITPDGQVVLQVDVNKDGVGRATTAGYAIDTKHIRTEVLVEDGGTVVIGGIQTQAEKQGEHRVPWLGEVPLIGSLFQNRLRTGHRTELLVFLTPRVVTSASPP